MHDDSTYAMQSVIGANKPVRSVRLRLLNPSLKDVDVVQKMIGGLRRRIWHDHEYQVMWDRYSIWQLSEHDPIEDHITIAHEWIRNVKELELSCKRGMSMHDTQDTAMAYVQINPEFMLDLGRLKIPFWASVDVLEYGSLSPDEED